MHRFLITLCSGFLLAACSGGLGTMDRVMSSWVGASLDEVISQWGFPHQQVNIAGRDLYVWNRDAVLFTPGSSTGSAQVIGNTVFWNSNIQPATVSSWSCSRILEVRNNRVVSWEWRGNNCPFADVGPYANWQRRGG
jgi:hypothetical protein